MSLFPALPATTSSKSLKSANIHQPWYTCRMPVSKQREARMTSKCQQAVNVLSVPPPPSATLQTLDNTSQVSTLQIQALGLTLLLGAQDTLSGGPEIRHLHTHAPLPQGHHASFRAYGLDIRTGQVVLL